MIDEAGGVLLTCGSHRYPGSLLDEAVIRQARNLCGQPHKQLDE